MNAANLAQHTASNFTSQFSQDLLMPPLGLASAAAVAAPSSGTSSLSPAVMMQYIQLLQGEQQRQSSTIPQSQGAALSQSTPRPRRKRTLTDQQKFLLFTKSLFQFLKLAGNERVRQRVKGIVAECARRNRVGDPDYSPLQAAVERRVRLAVGNDFYMKLQVYLERYCEQKGLNPISV